MYVTIWLRVILGPQTPTPGAPADEIFQVDELLINLLQVFQILLGFRFRELKRGRKKKSRSKPPLSGPISCVLHVGKQAMWVRAFRTFV